jgi:hypothetical protein
MRKGIIYNILDALFIQKKRPYQRPYNNGWDLALNKIINEGEFKEERNFVAIFQYQGTQYSIWVSNYPYSYAYAYKINEELVPFELQFRAKEKTMKKLHDFLEAPWIAQKQEKVKKQKKYIIGKD